MKIMIFEDDVFNKLKEKEGSLWASRQLIRDPGSNNFYDLKILWDHYISLHRNSFVPATDQGLMAASREINISPVLASRDAYRFYKLKYNGQLICYGKMKGRG